MRVDVRASTGFCKIFGGEQETKAIPVHREIEYKNRAIHGIVPPTRLAFDVGQLDFIEAKSW